MSEHFAVNSAAIQRLLKGEKPGSVFGKFPNLSAFDMGLRYTHADFRNIKRPVQTLRTALCFDIASSLEEMPLSSTLEPSGDLKTTTIVTTEVLQTSIKPYFLQAIKDCKDTVEKAAYTVGHHNTYLTRVLEVMKPHFRREDRKSNLQTRQELAQVIKGQVSTAELRFPIYLENMLREYVTHLGTYPTLAEYLLYVQHSFGLVMNPASRDVDYLHLHDSVTRHISPDSYAIKTEARMFVLSTDSKQFVNSAYQRAEHSQDKTHKVVGCPAASSIKDLAHEDSISLLPTLLKRGIRYIEENLDKLPHQSDNSSL